VPLELYIILRQLVKDISGTVVAHTNGLVVVIERFLVPDECFAMMSLASFNVPNCVHKAARAAQKDVSLAIQR